MQEKHAQTESLAPLCGVAAGILAASIGDDCGDDGNDGSTCHDSGDNLVASNVLLDDLSIVVQDELAAHVLGTKSERLVVGLEDVSLGC